MKSTAEVKAKGVTLIQETLPQENKVAEVVGFIEALKSIKPRTKQESIHIIHAVSAIMSAEKDLKAAAYGFLDTRCADCEEHESEDGLRVKKIVNQVKKYKSTKEVKEAEKDLEAAKEALQAAKDKAGFSLEEGASYWKAVR
jgi:hypothetical protein